MILVDIYAPSLERSFDFMLDENAAIDHVKAEMIGVIAKKTKSTTVPKEGEFLLYRMDPGQRLDGSKTLADYGIRDGSRLMIV